MFGLGAGMGMQMPLSAVQTVLQGGDIALGTSVLILGQMLGGAIFLAVAQSVFQGTLLNELQSAVPDVDAGMVIANGASGLKSLITDRYSPLAAVGVLESYNKALRECFLLCVVLSCLMVLGTLGMEWKSVRASKPQKDVASDEAEKAFRDGKRQP